MQKQFSRGFTLIELMIVIVILGVLMGTILPRLTGAQARARDTGRIADLNTLAQALETYYDDNGEYPDPGASGFDCLTNSSTVGALLADALKGGTIPTPPSATEAPALNATIKCAGGSYLYVALTARGLPLNGYALVSDVEVYQNANVDTGDTLIGFSNRQLTKSDDTGYSDGIDKKADLSALTNAAKETADDLDALRTVYMEVK